MSEFKWVEINNYEELTAFYHSILPVIREAAKSCGYAIGLHGSMKRDLDLIAVPWINDHSDVKTLAAAIHKAACGLKQDLYAWEYKPCGRIATSFPICFNTFYPEGVDGLGHIDLSVVGYDYNSTHSSNNNLSK